MSTSKPLAQLQSSLGTYRKNIAKLLETVERQYAGCVSVEDKATLLDQLMIVKSNIDKEYKYGIEQRDRRHRELVQKGKA